MISHNGQTSLTAATRRSGPGVVAQSSFQGVVTPQAGFASPTLYNPEGQVSTIDWAFEPQRATMYDPESNTVVPTNVLSLGQQPQVAPSQETYNIFA